MASVPGRLNPDKDERVSVAPLDPETALRALLNTPDVPDSTVRDETETPVEGETAD